MERGRERGRREGGGWWRRGDGDGGFTGGGLWMRKREAEGWVEWRTRSENGDNVFRDFPFRSKLHIFPVFA